MENRKRKLLELSNWNNKLKEKINSLEYKFTVPDLLQDVKNLREINQKLLEDNRILSQNKQVLYEAILKEKDNIIKNYEKKLGYLENKSENKPKKTRDNKNNKNSRIGIILFSWFMGILSLLIVEILVIIFYFVE